VLSHPALRGVRVVASECVLLGDDAGRAVVLGEFPHPETTADEVARFCAVLAESGCVAHSDPASTRSPTRARRLHAAEDRAWQTHRVWKRGKRALLARHAFVCASRE
jgi:hypothetical protein